MTQVAEAFVRLRSDDSLYKPEVRRQVQSATRDLERSGREAQRFGRGALVGTGALSQLGRAAAFASASFIGGAGLVVALRSASQAASSLNEQTSRSNVVFARSARSVQEWATTTAESTGLARDEALRAASEFGTLFSNIGTGASESAQLSEKIVQLGADLASFADTPVPEALAAIRSGLTGEVEPLRRYGVFLSEAQTQQQAFTETGKTAVNQLTTQDRVLARLNLVFKQTTLAQGDFARTSDDLANQQRILTANIRNFQALLGQTLNPTILKIVSGLNDWLSNTQNQDRVQREFTRAVGDAVAVGEGFAKALELIRQVTGPLVELVGGLTRAVELLVVAMAINKVARFAQVLGFVGPAGTAAAVGAGRAATSVRGVGTAATVATGRVRILSGALRTLGPLALAFGAIELLDPQSGTRAGLATETAGGGTRGKRGSPFLRGTSLNDAYQDAFDRLLRSGTLRRLDEIENIRAAGREGFDPIGLLKGTGFFSRPVGIGEQLRQAVALAGVTPGTADDVRALTAQRSQYQKSLDFALEQLRLGKGDTEQFASEVERLAGDIAGINNELANISEDNVQKAKRAREQRIARLIPNRIGGIAQGGLGVAQEFIAGLIGGVTGGRDATTALSGLGRAANLARLRTQIAEQSAESEESLLPFLRKEQEAIAAQLRILRLMRNNEEQRLTVRLALAQIRKRIRDIETDSDRFSVQDFFSLAAGQFAELGSNVGAVDVALSPQEAGGAAVRAARGVSVNQHFYGQQPNPAQALQQASQAARALR